MRVLLANDDGILAPGLLAMYRVLSADPDMQVDVVAPETVQSAAAHAITIRHPLLCRDVHIDGAFHGTGVEGSPADCVKLAVNALLPERPELVISGINDGANVGVHVLYSGTVAAAAEGAILRCPSIAVSLKTSDEPDFDRAARLAKPVIDQILRQDARPGRLYNVNLPAPGPGRPKGVRVVRQSTQSLIERFERRHDPAGRPYYWLSGDFGESTDEGDTDLRAIREGYIAVTPLHVDLTHAARLEQMQAWTWPELPRG